MAANQADADDKPQKECRHEEVIADYVHALGHVFGVHVAALRTAPQLKRNPKLKLELINPRCAKCGAILPYKGIKKRIKKGGDVYHSRFAWC
jgi:hypothetical protein